MAPAFAALAAGMSDGERVRFALADRWIAYTQASRAMDRLEQLLAHPRRVRMPNALLVAPTNNGKTMIAQRVVRTHPRVPDPDGDGDGDAIPVLYVVCPDAADIRRFHHRVVEATGAPTNPGDSLAKKEAQALRRLRDSRVRMLIVDEAHNILVGGGDRLRQMLNMFRNLGAELQIPIVAVGVKEVLQAFHSESQLANRFEPVALPRWRDGPALATLLARFEAVLPLRRPSNLVDPRMMRRLLALSEELLGEIAAILTRSAEQAILSGEERIDVAMVEALDFTPPAQRRLTAETLGVA